MAKTVLITGATDGIGLVTAQALLKRGHHTILHGRNTEKLTALIHDFSNQYGDDQVSSIQADLSNLRELRTMALTLTGSDITIDAIINNAGVFQLTDPICDNGLDARFVVNTLAPYLLTTMLLAQLPMNGRIVNVSSAAQASVDQDAFSGNKHLSSSAAYAQSKLALTMWSRYLGKQHANGPVIVSVNPKSFLGSKMVKQAYGVAGGDLSLGADILLRAAISDEFNQAHGEYFDNDIEAFSPPHPDALNTAKCKSIVEQCEILIHK